MDSFNLNSLYRLRYTLYGSPAVHTVELRAFDELDARAALAVHFPHDSNHIDAMLEVRRLS
jgi:hypothetical protein